MKKILVVLALVALGGCGVLKDLDLCSALRLARAAHSAAATGSALICGALKGEAKTECLKNQALSVKAGAAVLDAGDDIAKSCRVPLAEE
jgi:hypothetical protein